MTAADRNRLRLLLAAGWIDSFGLAFAWTVVMLAIVEDYGLQTAGLSGAAMLVGTALSAPVASHLARRLGGRDLLRTCGAVEAVLRASVFLLLWSGAEIWMLCTCIVAMNITAWTGYAGMRAEVAAVAPGPKALTLYATGVASVEAAGAACAVFLPSSVVGEPSLIGALVVLGYVAALCPTLVVAGDSRVDKVAAPAAPRSRSCPSTPMVAGFLLMFLASGPTLLSVALSAELFGRSAVAPAAIAFTIGSLTAPLCADFVQRRHVNGLGVWVICAVLMVLLWPLAPVHLALLCCAQLLSGLSMTSLEGLIDAQVASNAGTSVTGALARVTAGRALGAAAGTAALPLAISGVGLAPITLTLTGVLAVTAVSVAALHRSQQPQSHRAQAPTSGHILHETAAPTA